MISSKILHLTFYMYSICSFIFDFSWIVCGLKDLPRLLLRCYIGCLRQTLTGTFSSFWQVRSEFWCVACAAMNYSKRFISFLVKANMIVRRCCFWMVVFRAFSYLRPLFFLWEERTYTVNIPRKVWRFGGNPGPFSPGKMWTRRKHPNGSTAFVIFVAVVCVCVYLLIDMVGVMGCINVCWLFFVGDVTPILGAFRREVGPRKFQGSRQVGEILWLMSWWFLRLSFSLSL